VYESQEARREVAMIPLNWMLVIVKSSALIIFSVSHHTLSFMRCAIILLSSSALVLKRVRWVAIAERCPFVSYMAWRANHMSVDVLSLAI